MLEPALAKRSSRAAQPGEDPADAIRAHDRVANFALSALSVLVSVPVPSWKPISSHI